MERGWIFSIVPSFISNSLTTIAGVRMGISISNSFLSISTNIVVILIGFPRFVVPNDRLKESLEYDRPVGLGKCRYFNDHCKFKQIDLCSCKDEKDIDTITINEATRITLLDNSNPFSQKFSSYESALNIRFWDLFQPRKFLLKHTSPFYYEDFNDDYYYLRKALEDEIAGSMDEIGRRKSKHSEINDSILTYQEKPILIRFPKGSYSENKLNEWYIVQLGLIVLSEDCDEGYILTHFKDNDISKLWRIKFKKNKNFSDLVEKRIGVIYKSISDESAYSELPLCPDFVRKNCGDSCYCR